MAQKSKINLGWKPLDAKINGTIKKCFNFSRILK